MTSLTDTFRTRRDRRRLAQLVAGASFVLAGAGAFGIGFARVARDALVAVGVGTSLSTAAGLALAGLLFPGAFVALRARVDGSRGKQWLAPGGSLVGVSVAALLATAGSTGGLPAGPTAWPIGVAYAAGAALIVASFLASALEDGSTPNRPGVSYRRTTAGYDGRVPADGGEDEDGDLSFPLDDE